jgi:predicted RNase H-like HicB family nuclease
MLAWEGQTIELSEVAYPYTSVMADEDTVLDEAMDNLKEAGQRIRATQSLMRSQGMTDGENYRELLTRLSTALAMTGAAYLEAGRRRDP